MARYVSTVAEVIEALGDGDRQAGRRELMRITSRKTQHVTNWLAEERLPQWTWLIVSRALERRNKRMKPGLCRLAKSQAQAKAS